MVYTPTSWVNGVTAANAAHMNNIENWISATDQPAAVSVSGGSSGTATLYQPLTGIVKIVVIALNNFKTGGSAQNLALTTAFTTIGYMSVTDIVPLSTVLSSVVKNMNVITSIGSVTNNATISSYQTASIPQGFDTIQFQASASSAHTGMVFIVGI